MSKYKGYLEGFPEEVVEAMLDYQEEQGNERDVTVFDREKFEGRTSGGFTWADTVEGRNFWYEVIVNRNFKVFFDKYPKKEVKVEEREWREVKEPMRCRIDLGGGNKVEFLIDTLDINFDKGFIDIKAK